MKIIVYISSLRVSLYLVCIHRLHEMFRDVNLNCLPQQMPKPTFRPMKNHSNDAVIGLIQSVQPMCAIWAMFSFSQEEEEAKTRKTQQQRHMLMCFVLHFSSFIFQRSIIAQIFYSCILSAPRIPLIDEQTWNFVRETAEYIYNFIIGTFFFIVFLSIYYGIEPLSTYFAYILCVECSCQLFV